MDLSTFTEGQRQSVERLDGPLLVSAGAGSGKTFTLTQRIAYALLPESGPFLHDIDEVLAITFTDKAAREIKDRVRSTLLGEGLREQALKVDGAWISTIHGACGRILRTHALELGIDPSFSILSDAQRDELLDAAIDEALRGGGADDARKSFPALFAEFPARAAGFSRASVEGLLRKLLTEASNVPDGLGAVRLGPSCAPPSALARRLLTAYEDIRCAIAAAKRSKSSEGAAAAAGAAVDALRSYLDSEGDHASFEEFASALDGCAKAPRNFGTPEYKEQAAALNELLCATCAETAVGLGAPAARELLELARRVREIFERFKRDAGALDNDDLLTQTLSALKGHEEVRRHYVDRFKLVMVDEFQDTSQLQIDLISPLAGENLSRLCTVGDSQQSIYRFRGADVNVYERHKDTMKDEPVGALPVELSDNFRSHRDVLAFVDRVFEQDRSFGESFMSLRPRPGFDSSLRPGVPRIQFALCTYKYKKGTSGDAVAAAAEVLADRFAEYRDAGHRPGEMVVLLGRMTNAGTFRDALQRRGFECVIAGGSLFAGAPEVRTVASLLRALADPLDSPATFEVLSSGMFGLSPEDLLELATGTREDGSERARSLGEGLADVAEGRRSGRESQRVVLVAERFDEARRRLRAESAARVAERFVMATGWPARLESQGAVGRAAEANVLKALRSARRLEEERRLGPLALARAFCAELDSSKEKPGALSGGTDDAVRIMTIHASKGLEFPIVGVAEYEAPTARTESLVMEVVDGKLRCSLSAQRSVERFKLVDDCAKEFPKTEAARHAGEGAALAVEVPAAAFRASLTSRSAEEELAEARRKLYVALTRASEALVVVAAAKESSSGSFGALTDDMCSALFQGEEVPIGRSLCDIDGEQPCLFERVSAVDVLAQRGEGYEPASDAASPDAFGVVDESRLAPTRLRPWQGERRRAFSYTSLSVACDGKAGLPVVGEETALQDGANVRADDDASFGGEGDGVEATSLGVAFHRAAEYYGRTRDVPSPERLRAIAATCGLSDAGHLRLLRAAQRWFASDLFARASAFPCVRAEVPFMLDLSPEAPGEYLEGEIDLLCTGHPGCPDAERARSAESDRRPGAPSDPEGGSAFVVDYKTGGSPFATDADLLAKHRLQAQCYAAALLAEGFASVELVFAYVELDGGGGQPRCISYRYRRSDADDLRRGIAELRSRSTV